MTIALLPVVDKSVLPYTEGYTQAFTINGLEGYPNEILYILNEEIPQTLEDAVGGARSPRDNGEKTGILGATPTLYKHYETNPLFFISIMLHELLDHDDSPDSMLQAEQNVIQRIDKQVITQKELQDILSLHKQFFDAHDTYYQELGNPANITHHNKIKQTSAYLQQLLSGTGPEQLPAGSFYALSPEEARALQLVEQKGERVIANRKEQLLSLCLQKDPILSYGQIAQQIFGEEASSFPDVCKKAIGYVVRKLLTPEALALINQKKQNFFGEQAGERFGVYAKEGYEAVKAKYGDAYAELLSDAGKKAVLAKGFVPWTDEEKSTVYDLLTQKTFTHKQIAQKLNELYHYGKDMRTDRSIGTMLNKNKDKKKL